MLESSILKGMNLPLAKDQLVQRPRMIHPTITTNMNLLISQGHLKETAFWNFLPSRIKSENKSFGILVPIS